jgi:hypothetical protein
MKWYSPVFTFPIALVIVLLGGWGFYENKNPGFGKPALHVINVATPMPTHSSLSVPTYSASPSSTLLKETSAKSLEGWKTFVSDKYKFHFSYTGIFLYDNSSLVCDNEPTFFSMRLRCVTGLTYVRGPGEDEQYEFIIISAAAKDVSSTLAQWATAPNPDLHLHNIPQGDITDALAKAYNEQTELSENIRNPQYVRRPDEFVTRNESIEKGVEILELGAVLDSGGRLSYTTLLTKSGLKYVYSIELLMEPGKFATKPSDQELIEIYKKIISTFQFTN